MALLQPLLYIGLALLILAFMIAVHELGHYVAGKILGFKINEFAIGLGKPIFKRVSKKTGEVFSIRWIPFGGFCAFAGDDAAAGEGGARKEAEEREKQGLPTPKGVDFNKAAPWKRLIVLFAGGFFNFLSAIVFAIIIIMIVGYYQAVSFNSLVKAFDGSDSPNAALFQHAEYGNVTHIHGVGRTADTIKSFTLTKTIGSHLGQFNETDRFYLRVEYENGMIETVGGFQRFKLQDGSTGIGITGMRQVPLRGNFFEAIGYGVWYSLEIAWMILVILGMLVTGQLNIFGSVGGPTATVSIMAEVVSWGYVSMLMLIPLISINLALFNLLPIPALDGARMVFVGIEWVRGKPVNPELEGKIHMIGFLVLFSFMIIVDIAFWVVGDGLGIFLLLSKFLL